MNFKKPVLACWKINFVCQKDFLDDLARLSVFVDGRDPILDVLKGLGVSHVISQDDSGCPSVVRTNYGAEPVESTKLYALCNLSYHM